MFGPDEIEADRETSAPPRGRKPWSAPAVILAEVAHNTSAKGSFFYPLDQNHTPLTTSGSQPS
jgi:hypothetical protein